MATELFFLYDTHCPWSYASTVLIKEVSEQLPEIKINLLHCAHYDGSSSISHALIDAVKEHSSQVSFSPAYMSLLKHAQDSTIAANLMTWVQQKTPYAALPLLLALQKEHFINGNALTEKSDFDDIIKQFKLSPPAKVFNPEVLTKDTEINLHQIFELQEIIGTSAIPALLIAVEDNLILLNHNFYLDQPNAIIEAIELELK